MEAVLLGPMSPWLGFESLTENSSTGSATRSSFVLNTTVDDIIPARNLIVMVTGVKSALSALCILKLA